jgi:hypothetical protein
VFVEMRSTPSDRALIESIVAGSDVDLVVVHGPHSIQPLELVDGPPVFWSLGNLVSGMGVPGRGSYSDARALDGLLASVRFTEQHDGSFVPVTDPVLLCEMVDTRVVYPGFASSAIPVRRHGTDRSVSPAVRRGCLEVALTRRLEAGGQPDAESTSPTSARAAPCTSARWSVPRKLSA